MQVMGQWLRVPEREGREGKREEEGAGGGSAGITGPDDGR